MTTPQPSYLKIHRDDSTSDSAIVPDHGSMTSAAVGVSRAQSRCVVETCDSDRAVEGFWRAYTETTGWRIDPGPERSKPVAETPDVETTDEHDDSPSARTLTAAGAARLAKAAREMADQLQQHQAMMRLQQTELAARATVILDTPDAQKGADAIHRLLADATLATGTDAAGVYFLDEETERLTTRFVFGLAPEKRLGTSRPLRGARADLEAMVQGVVAMEDIQNSPFDSCSAPESFASGICVSLGGVELPIGTMWLYSRTVGDYPDAAMAAARLAAENICYTLSSTIRSSSSSANTQLSITPMTSMDMVDAELERILALEFNQTEDDESELEEPNFAETDREETGEFDIAGFVEAMEPLSTRPVTAINQVPATLKQWTNQISDWQHDTLPMGTHLAPGWSVDGMVESPLSIAQSWHHWDVLPDGVIAIAACQFANGWKASGDMVDTLDATIARAALQSHASYRHSTQEAITRILHTLLQIRDGAIDETGRANLSLFYAHVDPESGHAKMSSIGKWSSLIVSKYGYRPLNLSRTPGIRADEIPGEQAAMNQETTLLGGEVLLVGGADWMGMADETEADHLPLQNRFESKQNRVGLTIKQAMMEGERSPLAALRRMTAAFPLRRERNAISLLRD